MFSLILLARVSGAPESVKDEGDDHGQDKFLNEDFDYPHVRLLPSGLQG